MGWRHWKGKGSVFEGGVGQGRWPLQDIPRAERVTRAKGLNGKGRCPHFSPTLRGAKTLSV